MVEKIVPPAAQGTGLKFSRNAETRKDCLLWLRRMAWQAIRAMISHTPAAIKPGSLRSAAMRPALIWVRFKRWQRNERALELGLVTETALSLTGSKPRPCASILSIDPYVPGKNGAPGEAKVFKLSAN